MIAILIVLIFNPITNGFDLYSQELEPIACVAAAEVIAPLVFSAECHGITIGVAI